MEVTIKQNKIININSLILALYIYRLPIFCFMPILKSNPLNAYIYLLLLLIFSLINNSFRIGSKFIFAILTIMILMNVNLIFTNYARYVFIEYVVLVIYLSVPLHVFTSSIVDVRNMVLLLFDFASFFTILLPVNYFFLTRGYLSYLEIGNICHIIILSATVKYTLNNKFTTQIAIVTLSSFVVGLILGSRGTVFASVSLLALVFLSKIIAFLKNSRYSHLHKSLVSMFAFIALYWFVNKLSDIASLLAKTLDILGINSRNIFLLSGLFSKGVLYLSGREFIYAKIYDYLKDSILFPRGLGVVRIMTDGRYYHAHNIFLQMLLVFGLPLSVLFLFIFIKRLFVLKRLHIFEFKVSCLFIVSFLTRGVTGSYFIADTIFLVVFCFLFFKVNIKSSSSHNLNLVSLKI